MPAELVPSKPATLTELMAERHHLSGMAFLNAIRATVFKEGSNEQLCAFLMVAEKYDLDPLTREIYAVAAKGGGIIPIVPLDGWAKKVNEHPQFDGFEFGDTFDDHKRIVSITCRMYRRDRSRPGEITEYLSECARDTEPWRKWPVRMLRWKAYIQCARVTFGLSGIYDPDEAARIDPSQGAVIEAQEYASNTSAPVATVVATSPYDAEIDALMEQLKINSATRTQLRQNHTGRPEVLLEHLRGRLSPAGQVRGATEPTPVQPASPLESGGAQQAAVASTTKWDDLAHKSSPEVRASLRAEAELPPFDAPSGDRVVDERLTRTEAPARERSISQAEAPRRGRGRPTREEMARRQVAEQGTLTPQPEPPLSEQKARQEAEQIVEQTDRFAF